MTEPKPVTEPTPASRPSSVTEHSPVAELNLLTVAEVAATMRVSKMSVYRLIHAGEIEAVRFGRTFRIPRIAAEEYLRSSYFHAG